MLIGFADNADFIVFDRRSMQEAFMLLKQETARKDFEVIEVHDCR